MLGLDPLDGVVTVIIGVEASSLGLDALGCKILLAVSLPLCAAFKVFLCFNPWYLKYMNLGCDKFDINGCAAF